MKKRLIIAIDTREYYNIFNNITRTMYIMAYNYVAEMGGEQGLMEDVINDDVNYYLRSMAEDHVNKFLPKNDIQEYRRVVDMVINKLYDYAIKMEIKLDTVEWEQALAKLQKSSQNEILAQFGDNILNISWQSFCKYNACELFGGRQAQPPYCKDSSCIDGASISQRKAYLQNIQKQCYELIHNVKGNEQSDKLVAGSLIDNLPITIRGIFRWNNGHGRNILAYDAQNRQFLILARNGDLPNVRNNEQYTLNGTVLRVQEFNNAPQYVITKATM